MTASGAVSTVEDVLHPYLLNEWAKRNTHI